MLRNVIPEAARSLVRDVRFTGVAVALLAITIGATTAVYAIVQAVVLRPFPFTDQDRVVVIWQRDDRRAQPVIEVAYGEMTDWRARSRSFDDLGVVGSVNWSVTFPDASAPESVPLSAVSASFFPVVGTSPFLGRRFESGDEDGQGPRVMIISHGLWLRRFGGDPAVVGRTVPIKLGADSPPAPIEIVGIMPAAFDFPRGAEVWMPAAALVRGSAAASGADDAIRGLRVFFALGRLKRGVPLDSASRELTHVMQTADMGGYGLASAALVLTPIATYLLGPAKPVLWTLLAGATLMLIIACANVAGLQIARSARRQRALAIRVALGASTRHVIGAALIESVLITVAALVGGAALASVTARTLIALAPAGIPRLAGVTLMSTPVLVFGAAATFITVLLCGMWPALVAARIDALSVLAHGGSVAADPRGRRIQRTVVIAQVAIALTLLMGTALFARTLGGLVRTALGFDPAHLLAMNVTPATDDLTRWNGFYDALIHRVDVLPDVMAAGAVALRPLSGPIGWDTQPMFPGQIPKQPATWGLNPYMNLEIVTPGYFRAMGMRLLRGRVFSATDTAASPGVVVVSETAARRLWPGREPIGQRLRDQAYRTDAPPGSPAGWQTVIGVVEDVRYRGLNDLRLDLYLPATQSTNRVGQLMIRSRADPADVVRSVSAAARELDPNAGVSDAAIMTEVVKAESAPWRFLVQVFLAFAALSATLAAIGLGAVVALAVASRRRELAIRAALGADRARLRAVMLQEGLALVVVGIALGVLGALALGRAVAHVLVGVRPHDPVALSGAAVVEAALAVLASWVPARRAAGVDPIEALRSE
jgi:putative ABC transport system permease protein